jgi:hypothetical protein
MKTKAKALVPIAALKAAEDALTREAVSSLAALARAIVAAKRDENSWGAQPQSEGVKFWMDAARKDIAAARAIRGFLKGTNLYVTAITPKGDRYYSVDKGPSHAISYSQAAQSNQ